MLRPRIKFSHRPVRYGAEHVRIGGIVTGLRRDFLDRGGWRWALLGTLDGTRTVEGIIATMVASFPDVSRRQVREIIDDLVLAGYLEDAQESPTNLDEATKDRYGRGSHLFQWMDLTPGNGRWTAQETLARSHVVVVGLGGVGCTAALDLVLSGVGHVHCVDRDVVEWSNLNRQILYTEADIGHLKVEIAVRRLHAYNSTVNVTGTVLDVTGPDILRALATDVDALLIAADDPRPIRSWTNQACVATDTPWVYGGYHGPLISVGLFRPGDGPCFECGCTEGRTRRLDLPTRTEWPPAIGRVQPQAADATSAGLTGNFAARAVISLLTGIPDLPSNLQFGFNLVTLRETPAITLMSSHPHCPVCNPAVQ